MLARLHLTAVHRRVALCALLWAVAFFGCSVHCALGFKASDTTQTKHACCDQTPAAPQAGKSCCQGAPSVTSPDTLVGKLQFTPQFVALLVPLVCAQLPAAASLVVQPAVVEPEVGPPSHVPLMRLAGRAPPLVA